jgi:hypothetical protein
VAADGYATAANRGVASEPLPGHPLNPAPAPLRFSVSTTRPISKSASWWS